MISHERRVEKFYSHGSNLRSMQDGGFLSFGLWREDTADYRQAAENLLNMLLENEKILHRGRILNVACGYGSETFEIYERLSPEKIIAIDVTEAHIRFAAKKTAEYDFAQKIIFEKQDACVLPYLPGSFAYVIGVEGPAHFNTRETFLRRAYDVLEPRGVLLLTDIIVNTAIARRNLCTNWIGRRVAARWHMPEANWMTTESLVCLLKTIGFRIDMVKDLGRQVYPGFAKYNTRLRSIVSAVKTRGVFIGFGLTVISWFLGWAFRRGALDYVFVRAVREH